MGEAFHYLPCRCFIHPAEQTPPDHLANFLFLDRGVNFLHPSQDLLHLLEQAFCIFVVLLQEAGGKGNHQAYLLQGAHRLGEFLQEGLGLGRKMAFAHGHTRGFGDIGKHLIHQD